MTDKCKSHGGKPIEFCGDQEGWIAVASLSDDSPLSPCFPHVVLLGMGLGESGKMHPSNIAAMLTIDQATDLRERLTSAMTVDRPAPTPAADPLATVRAALDVASKATTGEWECEPVDVFGTLTEWAALIGPRRPGSDWPRKSDLRHEDAVAIVALHNAAPAIAELCAEVAERRETASRQLAAIGRVHDRISAKLSEAKRMGMEAVEVARAVDLDLAKQPRVGGHGLGTKHSNNIAAIAAALEAL